MPIIYEEGVLTRKLEFAEEGYANRPSLSIFRYGYTGMEKQW